MNSKDSVMEQLQDPQNIYSWTPEGKGYRKKNPQNLKILWPKKFTNMIETINLQIQKDQ